MADGTESLLQVQICYASPEAQIVLDLSVASGTTIQAVIAESGLLQQAPDIDLMLNRVGIYGKIKPLETLLRNHDRIEIYRPLTADPKDTRRIRAGIKSRGQDEKKAR